MGSSHRDQVKEAVHNACDSYDLEVAGDLDMAQTASIADTIEYRVSLPVSGTVLLNDVLENQGALMYSKENVEVELKGFTDNLLVLTVRIEQ